MASGQISVEEYNHHKKDVYKTTGILSIITIVEVLFALFYEFKLVRELGWPRIPLNIFLIVASLLKGIFIMGVFMHVKHETKGFIMTILCPFAFLIWMIIAFMWEGASWSEMRDLLNWF